MKRSFAFVFIAVSLLWGLLGITFGAKAENEVSGQVDVRINLTYTVTSGSRLYANIIISNTSEVSQTLIVTSGIQSAWIISESFQTNEVNDDFGNEIQVITESDHEVVWLAQVSPHNATKLVIGSIAGIVTETKRIDDFYHFDISGANVFSGTQPLQIDPSLGNVLTSISPSTVSAGQEFCVYGQIMGGSFVFRLPDGYFDLSVNSVTPTMACGLIENIKPARYHVYMTNKFGASSNPMNLTVVNRSWMPTAIRK